jgi:hypothetical protein
MARRHGSGIKQEHGFVAALRDSRRHLSTSAAAKCSYSVPTSSTQTVPLAVSDAPARMPSVGAGIFHRVPILHVVSNYLLVMTVAGGGSNTPSVVRAECQG